MMAHVVAGVALYPWTATGQAVPSSSSAAAAQATANSSSPTLESQMQRVLEELKQLRQQNQDLQERVTELESVDGSHNAAHLASAVGAMKTPAAPAALPAPPQTSGNPPVAEVPSFPWIRPFGEFGIRYEGLFNEGTHSGYSNLSNQPQVLGRFGIKGQIDSRVDYIVRV